MQHEVFEHDLGGAKGLVVHVPGARVNTLVVRFNSGFQFGDFERYELPHVLEHLMGASTTNYPEHVSLKIEIEKNGAYRNAHTSAIGNWYDFEFAAFEQDRIIGLQHEYFLETKFPQEITDTEIGNVRQELNRNNSQPASICGLAFLESAAPWLHMAADKRIEQLPGITPRILEEYLAKSHTWNNLRLYLVGDFPDRGEQAMTKLTKALDGLPKGKRFEPDRRPLQGFSPMAVDHQSESVFYNTGWFTGVIAQELWPAAVILRSLLGEGYASRIYGNARHRGLAYGIGCGVDFGQGSSALEFWGYVTPDNAEELFKLIADQMSQVKQGQITDTEVQAAKDLRSGSQLRAYQTAGQLLNWYMGHYEEREAVEDFNGWIDKLRAVTKEQVIEVAKHLCRTDARGAAFLGKVTDEDARKFAAILDPVNAA